MSSSNEIVAESDIDFEENNYSNDEQELDAEEERRTPIWKSKKYGKIFEQIKINDIPINQLQCKKCDSIFSPKSKMSIRFML